MTAKSTTVDVIILSLNRIEETITAVASALEQKGVTKNIWIVDQASDASQHARLKSFVDGKPVVLKSLSENVGVSAGRNIASRMGRASYIVALDNDAVFSGPHTLERAIAHLESDPMLGAVGFRILDHSSRKDDVSSWVYHQKMTSHASDEFATAQFVGAGHAMRRAAFEAAGGYDDDLFWLQDEICARRGRAAQKILRMWNPMAWRPLLLSRPQSALYSLEVRGNGWEVRALRCRLSHEGRV